ncbi:sigma-70 family RNA polymerase sigma factor [soil metagenome]
MTNAFEASRARLSGIAYRLLGGSADIDDVLQEAWLRWERADKLTIESPAAWLTTCVTRLALDRLRKRKRDQVHYLGPWLPTPVLSNVGNPADAAELADSMTMAFLIMLEELTPDERVAFLLADVFGERFDTIADILQRTSESCRQLASRARRKVQESQSNRRDELHASRVVVDRFLEAILNGDERSAMQCLSEDIVSLSDGGPDRHAARRPVHGRDRVYRLLHNLWGRIPATWNVQPAVVGGYPGLVFSDQSGIKLTTSFEVVDGLVVRTITILNPDKLAGIDQARQLGDLLDL